MSGNPHADPATAAPLLLVDPAGPVPPYEQIRLGLARQITEGDLPVGTALPTVRGLAADLGVAANTVARAYRELEAAGLVETAGRRGTRVAAHGDAVRAEAAQAAARFAQVIGRLGLSTAEALGVVRAALEATVTDPGR